MAGLTNLFADLSLVGGRMNGRPRERYCPQSQIGRERCCGSSHRPPRAVKKPKVKAASATAFADFHEMQDAQNPELP